jgi:hypothetical protein
VQDGEECDDGNQNDRRVFEHLRRGFLW